MTSQLPSGTVTFLFSDIEGSTRLLQELRGSFAEARAEHERLLRGAFAAHGGLEIDTQGDSFFVAFARAKDAVLAAVAAQRALVGHKWPENAQVRVRMGIHTGEPVVKDGRYVGMAVHRAARIMAAGHGGQILLSEATRRLVDEGELDGLRLRSLGEHRLKDIAQPEGIFQLEAPGLPSRFPHLQTRASGRLASRRARLAAGTVALFASASVAAAAIGLRGGGSSGISGLAPHSLGAIDPETNRLVAEVAVGRRPTRVAVGEGAVWVLNADDRTVSRIDPKQREVVRTVPIPGSAEVAGLAAGEGAVWVGSGLAGPLYLSRINPGFGEVADTIPLGRSDLQFFATPWHVAAGDGSVWVAGGRFGMLLRIDPHTLEIVSRIDPHEKTTAIAVGQGSVWVAPPTNVVVRIDPRTKEVVDRVRVANGTRAIAVGAGAVWVAAAIDDVVSRIDPATGSVTSIGVGDLPTAVAVGRGAVWVANAGAGTVSRIDPGTREVVATIELGSAPEGIAVGENLVWVAVSASLGSGD